MEMTKRKPVAPFYAVGVLWVTYACFFPLYEQKHYSLLVGVSIGVFILVSLLCRGEVKAQATTTAAPKVVVKKEVEETTGNVALDKMLKDGRLAIGEMKRLDKNIADPNISADIVRLEEVSQKIFDAVKAQPNRLSQTARFMDYYLPTTLKLLNAYDRMSATGVSGENIDGTLAKVEGMMRNIVAAFEKQLDALYGSEALDISTDITVLETMMAREGLTGEQLKAETLPKDDMDIKLEL